MKNLLLLSFAFLMTFSCTEYNDDGLPNSEDLVIYNPDGSKKIKHYHSEVITTQEFPNPDEPTPTTNTTNTVTDIDYDTNSYGFESTITTTGEVSGFEDLPDIGDGISSITTGSSTEENGRLTQVIMTLTANGESSTTRTSYAYTGDNIASVTTFENNEQLSQAIYTYNDNNVVVEKSYTDQQYGSDTMTFFMEDGLITSALFENTFASAPTNITFQRDSVNVTQIDISRGSESIQVNYTYDDAHYYLHDLGSYELDTRFLSELIALSNSDNYTTANQDPLLINVEAGLRDITNLATNNLLTVTIDGEVFLTNTYTYDEDNYPITMSSEYDADATMDSAIETITSQLYDQYITMGMTPEEAQQMVDDWLETFGDGFGSTQISATAEIEYFE